jgi:hypothetical protein
MRVRRRRWRGVAMAALRTPLQAGSVSVTCCLRVDGIMNERPTIRDDNSRGALFVACPVCRSWSILLQACSVIYVNSDD